MHTIEIKKKGLRREFASCFDELKQDEFIEALRLALLVEKEEISLDDFAIRMVYKLIDIKYDKLSEVKEGFLNEVQKDAKFANLALLAEKIDFFWKNDDDKLRLNYTSTKNFIQEIEINGITYAGPADALTDCVWLEFTQLTHYHTAYVNTKDESMLNCLIACVYRPKIDNYETVKKQRDYNGQRRMKFNPELIEQDASIIADLAFHIRFGIYMFIGNCIEYLATAKFDISGPIDFSILFNKTGTGKDDGLGWTGLTYSLAEDQSFGNMSEVSYTALYDVLFKLYRDKFNYNNRPKTKT